MSRTDPPPERLHWTEVGVEADETGVDPAANTAPARIRTRADVIGTRADRILRFRDLAPVPRANWYRLPVLGSGPGPEPRPPVLGNQETSRSPVGSAYRPIPMTYGHSRSGTPTVNVTAKAQRRRWWGGRRDTESADSPASR